MITDLRDTQMEDTKAAARPVLATRRLVAAAALCAVVGTAGAYQWAPGRRHVPCRHSEAQPSRRDASIRTAAVSDEEEEDWVAARIAEENRAFHAKREAANLARTAAWAEEERALRAEDVPLQILDIDDSEELVQAPGRLPLDVGDTRPGFQEREIPSGSVQAGQDVVAEYEARMREMARARPNTEEEKRDARYRDMLAQIEQADAMDERLRKQQRAARPDG